MKTYQPWNPRQSFLLPPSLDEWLPQSHLVYLVLDVVQTLDISEIERELQCKDHRGQRSYDPRMILALLIYAYCHGITSSRQMARLCWHDVAFRVLAVTAHQAAPPA
jgi:transposase